MKNWLKWVPTGFACGALLIVATFRIASCVRLDRSVTAGTIVAKMHHPAHLQPIVIGGKTPVVTCTYIPDSWYIAIEGIDANGNTRRIEQSVHEHEYDAAEIGAAWTRTPTE